MHWLCCVGQSGFFTQASFALLFAVQSCLPDMFCTLQTICGIVVSMQHNYLKGYLYMPVRAASIKSSWALTVSSTVTRLVLCIQLI